MTEPEDTAARRYGTADLALAVGVLVAAFTIGVEAGVVGVRDFLDVAVLGALATVFCVVVALECGHHGRRAAAGAVLSMLPVVLLVVFLSVSDG
jgi:putative Mn2+ efflux pump MntP